MTLINHLKAKATRLKADIPVLFIALRHRDTPVLAKILACVTVIYALSPIDLIPDFIPVLGLLDDIIILPALITLTVKLIPQAVFDECRANAIAKPKKKWYYAILIILLWSLIFFVIAGSTCNP